MKFKKLILSVLLFVFAVTPVFADLQTEILDRIDSDTLTSDTLVSKVENLQNDLDGLQEFYLNGTNESIQHFTESSNFYRIKANESDDQELTTILISQSEVTIKLANSLEDIKNAVESGDESLFESSLTEYDNQLSIFNENVNKLNSYYGLYDYYPILAVSSVISLIISAYLLLISRGKPILPAEQLRNVYEFELFKSSLWPLAGSGISFVWYALTPEGGTFYFLWGAILFGYLAFFKGLFTYFKDHRPEINRLKKEQQAKLHEYLSSNE